MRHAKRSAHTGQKHEQRAEYHLNVYPIHREICIYTWRELAGKYSRKIKSPRHQDISLHVHNNANRFVPIRTAKMKTIEEEYDRAGSGSSSSRSLAFFCFLFWFFWCKTTTNTKIKWKKNRTKQQLGKRVAAAGINYVLYLSLRLFDEDGLIILDLQSSVPSRIDHIFAAVAVAAVHFCNLWLPEHKWALATFAIRCVLARTISNANRKRKIHAQVIFLSSQRFNCMSGCPRGGLCAKCDPD